MSSTSLICSSTSSNLLLNPSSVFFISVIIFLSCDWFSLILYIYLLKFSLYSSILLHLVSMFMTITLKYFLEDCLSPFHLVPFLRFCLILSIGTYFSSSFCLILCVSFYLLDKYATSLHLDVVALCRRCLVGLISTILPGLQSQALKRYSLYGLHPSSCCGRAVAAAAVC